MAAYEFHPAGIDVWDPRPSHPPAGTKVKLSKQSGVGTRPPGLFGNEHRYVEDAHTGQFYGLVHKDSLRRVTGAGTAPGPTTGTTPPVFRDRRGAAPAATSGAHACLHCGHVGQPSQVEAVGRMDPYTGATKNRNHVECESCHQWSWHRPA